MNNWNLLFLKKLFLWSQNFWILSIPYSSKHSRNLATLIKTMEKSLRELSFLMLFFIVSMILFSTFVYFCEVAENSAMFPSIPSSFWWAIVTMTTVGYGDTYPISPLGKVVGFFCAICGVLCIALPVPSIVSNFHRIYQVSLALLYLIRRSWGPHYVVAKIGLHFWPNLLFWYFGHFDMPFCTGNFNMSFNLPF